MKQQEQQRTRARMTWMENQQAVQEQLELTNSTLVSRMTDKQARRTFELNRQVSLTKDKNRRQEQKFNEITVKFAEDAEIHYQSAIKH